MTIETITPVIFLSCVAIGFAVLSWQSHRTLKRLHDSGKLPDIESAIVSRITWGLLSASCLILIIAFL